MKHLFKDGVSGRRHFERLRLNIPARLTTFDGTFVVVLNNLSRTGAYLTRPRTDPISQGVLEWLGYEVFGDIIWHRLGHCGMQFEAAIDEEWVNRTRALSSNLIRREERALRSAAREWVSGDVSFGSRR